MAGVPRDAFLNVVHYIHRRVTSSTPNVGSTSGVEMPFALPDGAIHVATHINIVTAFNAGTTNVLTVGNASSATAYADSTAAGAGVAGMKASVLGTGRVSGDTTVLVKYTSTGTAPTAGEADVWLSYLPRRDN